jgi:hypothetical protein
MLDSFQSGCNPSRINTDNQQHPKKKSPNDRRETWTQRQMMALASARSRAAPADTQTVTGGPMR